MDHYEEVDDDEEVDTPAPVLNCVSGGYIGGGGRPRPQANASHSHNVEPQLHHTEPIQQVLTPREPTLPQRRSSYAGAGTVNTDEEPLVAPSWFQVDNEAPQQQPEIDPNGPLVAPTLQFAPPPRRLGTSVLVDNGTKAKGESGRSGQRGTGDETPLIAPTMEF